MAVPSLPNLLHNSCTVTDTANVATWMASLVTAINATTGDNAVSIPANARWVATTADSSRMVVAVPAATSPMAGKVVLVWAYQSGTAPGATAMLSPEAATATCLYFGAYWSNGTAVSAADVTAAWSTNAATGPFNASSTGTFTGWSKFYAGTTSATAIVFKSAETLIVQLEETGGGMYACWGGAGVVAPTDNVLDCEAGMGGRVYDFGTSGASAAMTSTFLTTSSANGGPVLGHGNLAGNCHWWYRVPGQTASANVATMRAMSNRAAGTAYVGPILSDAVNCYTASGAVQPQPVIVRDVVTSGTRTNYTVGTSRSFYYGPRRRSRAILNSAWIAFGQTTAADNDALLLPYA